MRVALEYNKDERIEHAKQADRICMVFESVKDMCDAVLKNPAENTIDPILLKELMNIAQGKATAMENGLRDRKKMMTDANIEESYQAFKQSKGEAKNRADAVNLKREINEKSDAGFYDYDNPPKYEVVVKMNDEVIYHNNTYAGTISFVERVDDINPEIGMIDGQTQNFTFGHPYLIFYAFDRLHNVCEDYMRKVVWNMKRPPKMSKQDVFQAVKEHFNVRMQALRSLDELEKVAGAKMNEVTP